MRAPSSSPASSAEGAPARVAPRTRLDIQGLRGIAVLLVIGYHLAPRALPGGFIGVDVFFVLSGFLITGLLLGHPGTPPPGVRGFLSRRARRLLPTAGIVLVATLGAGLLLVPVTRWASLAAETAASGLQVENWLLALSRTEYSAAVVASPLQQFWSLSVEWQAYLVWMLLFAAAGVAGRVRRRVALAGSVALTLLSLLLTATVLRQDAELLFFAAPSRLWEFGVGATLALLPAVAWTRVAREALAALGLGAILVAALLADAARHPGFWALLPTLGTAALLEAGRAPAPTGVGRVLGASPLRLVGDNSYAAYLWHWPVLVFALAVSRDDAPGPVGIVAVVALTALLAVVTTRWVEDPVRRRLPPGRARVAVAAAFLAPLLAAAPVLIGVNALRQTAPDQAHPGALAIDPAVSALLPDVAFIPDLAVAATDRGDAGPDLECLRAGSEPVVCEYGDAEADRVMVIVGDSHAWQWVPVLDEIARAEGWRLETLVRPSCPLAPTLVDIPGVGDDGQCGAWREAALVRLESQRPDLVLTAGLTPSGYETIDYHVADPATFAAGYLEVWSRLGEAGIAVAAIRDTPYLPVDVPECVAESRDTPERCDGSRADVLDQYDDPLVTAAITGGYPLIDLSDWICRAEVCPVVVGNVLVYRDRHHLTATYARTLETPLRDSLLGWGLLGD